jgi:transposase
MAAKETFCYWVGLDVGKQEFSAAIDLSMDDLKLDVLRLPCKTFKNTEKGVSQFLKWVDRMIPEYPFKVVMETTGHYSVSLCKLLHAKRKGLECCIADSYRISNYLKSLNLPHKTDSFDAQGIARFGRERQPEPTMLPTREEEELKEMSRQRAQLVKAKTAFKNRAESLASESVRRLNADFLKTLEENIDSIDRMMAKLARKIPWAQKQIKLAQSIPGVGMVTAVGLTAELGDLTKYTRKGVSASSGLSPRLFESGTSVKHSKISKRSPGRIRQLMFMCSTHAVDKIPYLRVMYDRLVSRGKTKMRARCACMRVLMQIIRSVVVNERPYTERLSYQSLEKNRKTA